MSDIIQHYKDNAKAQGRFLFLVHQCVNLQEESNPHFWERLMWWWSTHADKEMVERYLDDTLVGSDPDAALSPAWVEALSEDEFKDIYKACVLAGDDQGG